LYYPYKVYYRKANPIYYSEGVILRGSVMERKTTSIKVEPQLWKETKKLAIDRGVDVSELVESALKKELQKK